MNYRPLTLADAMRRQPPSPRGGSLLLAYLAALAMFTRDAETDGEWVVVPVGWTAVILYSAWLVYRTVRANQQDEQ